jgi:hypothetical protein
MDATLLMAQARLRLPDGSPASFAADTAVTVAWYSSYLSMGGTQAYALDYHQPRVLGTSNTASEYRSRGIRLTGRGFTHFDGPLTPPLLEVWAYEPGLSTTPPAISTQRSLGIYANGNISSLFGHSGTTYANDTEVQPFGNVHHTFAHRSVFLDSLTSGNTVFIDPQGKTNAPFTLGMGFSGISVNLTGAGLSAFTLNFTSTTGVTTGTFAEVFVENYGDGIDGLDVTLNWGPEFLFSDPSDAQLGAVNLTQGAVARWRMTVMITISSNGPRWFVERLPDFFL